MIPIPSFRYCHRVQLIVGKTDFIVSKTAPRKMAKASTSAKKASTAAAAKKGFQTSKAKKGERTDTSNAVENVSSEEEPQDQDMEIGKGHPAKAASSKAKKAKRKASTPVEVDSSGEELVPQRFAKKQKTTSSQTRQAIYISDQTAGGTNRLDSPPVVEPTLPEDRPQQDRESIVGTIEMDPAKQRENLNYHMQTLQSGDRPTCPAFCKTLDTLMFNERVGTIRSIWIDCVSDCASNAMDRC